MYRTGEQIEYANGILATVVHVPSEGTRRACGAFIIYQAGAGYALCWQDLETDEEQWGFHDEGFNDEDSPFVPTLEDALALYYEGDV